MSDKERAERIVAHHEKETEGEVGRVLEEDYLYDGIAWNCARPYLPKRGRILDAGGGAGVWSVRMAEETECTVVLFDIAPRLLEAARTRVEGLPISGRVEVVEADLRNIPFDTSSFDFVLCEGDPISICGDPERALRELSRTLRTGGHLAAGVDSTLYRAYRALSKGASLSEVLDFLGTGMSPAEEGAGFESKSFTPSEFASLARKSGLNVVKVFGRPISVGGQTFDAFVQAIPPRVRGHISKSPVARQQLNELLRKVYTEQYVAAMGSHLFVLAEKVG